MTSEIQIAELLQQIRSQVEERRAAGLYPPGLEQQLEREFAEIIRSTNHRYFAYEELQFHLKQLEDAFVRLSGQTSTGSQFPGVSLVHRLVRKLISRQILGLAAQVRDVESQVVTVLNLMGEFAKAQQSADNRVVRELSQHVLDRVAVVDHLAILTTELEARVRNLESRLGQ
jgi:hypothetical protein